MRKNNLNIICGIVVIITVAIFLVTLTQNFVVRSGEVYSFYFNDSGVTSQLYTELTSNEIADGIADFMNSWMPEEFQIYEDTGYDMQGIFDEDDSHNMMIVKKWLDISALACVLSLIITVACYWRLIKFDEKKRLRIGYRIGLVIAVAIAVGEVIVLLSHQGRAWLAGILGFIELSEDSPLLTVLGPEFLTMAAGFVVFMTVIVYAVCSYVSYRLTRPPRIFY